MTGTRPRSSANGKAAFSREDAVSDVVARYNRDYALLQLGDRPVVMLEGTGPDGRDDVRLLSLDGFRAWNRPDVIWLGEGEKRTKVQAANL